METAAGIFNRHQFVNDLEDSENSPENSGGGGGGGDSPRFAAVSTDTKIASTSSSKRSSRRAIQKRVVSVPIKDVEGLRLKADQVSAPPSDSWAWRKYGQKPIKGSPYPRGYYRCSSSKGCPARKQVERSRADPKMLLVTYYCEHNHNSPLSKVKSTTFSAAAAAAAKNVKTPTSEEEEEEEEDDINDEEVEVEVEVEEEGEEEKNKPRNILLTNQSHEVVAADHNKFSSNLGEGLLIHNNAQEFGWFADFECSNSCAMLESPMLAEDRICSTTDTEMAMRFTMREEDESLFADLGELPECSTVFRRGVAAHREAEQRRPGLTTTS